jgi:hypothetical protein
MLLEFAGDDEEKKINGPRRVDCRLPTAGIRGSMRPDRRVFVV